MCLCELISNTIHFILSAHDVLIIHVYNHTNKPVRDRLDRWPGNNMLINVSCHTHTHTDTPTAIWSVLRSSCFVATSSHCGSDWITGPPPGDLTGALMGKSLCPTVIIIIFTTRYKICLVMFNIVAKTMGVPNNLDCHNQTTARPHHRDNKHTHSVETRTRPSIL